MVKVEIKSGKGGEIRYGKGRDQVANGGYQVA